MEKDDARDAKRPRQEEESAPPGALLLELPYELTLQVLNLAAARGDLRASLGLLKNLRLVNKDLNHIATDVLLDTYIKFLEAVVEQIRTQIGEAWTGTTVSDERSALLTRVFDEVAAASSELKFFKDKVEEKKKARATIFNNMAGIDNATKWQLLRACSLDSELLGVKGVANTIKRNQDALADRPARRSGPPYGMGDYDDDPLRVPRPGGPPGWPYAPHPYGPGGGAPPIFGEPDPDHMRVPDWERDRNPPDMPGMPGGGDPFSPFGPGGADPFGRGGRGRGPRGPFGGGPDPFNPHMRGPPGPRFL